DGQRLAALEDLAQLPCEVLAELANLHGVLRGVRCWLRYVTPYSVVVNISHQGWLRRVATKRCGARAVQRPAPQRTLNRAQIAHKAPELPALAKLPQRGPKSRPRASQAAKRPRGGRSAHRADAPQHRLGA